jgi:hypothetical protein
MDRQGVRVEHERARAGEILDVERGRAVQLLGHQVDGQVEDEVARCHRERLRRGERIGRRRAAGRGAVQHAAVVGCREEEERREDEEEPALGHGCA